MSDEDALAGVLDRDSGVRGHCLSLLGEAYKGEPTRKNRFRMRLAARALLSDSWVCNRDDAVVALGSVGTRDDYHAVVERLEDKEWIVRASAYSTLASIGGRRAAPRFRKGFDDPHPVVRRYAAVALWDLLGKAACDELLEALSHEADDLARIGFLVGLAHCGNAGAIDELRRFAANPDPWLHSTPRGILEELA
jgi:HEAT repeat protein